MTSLTITADKIGLKQIAEFFVNLNEKRIRRKAAHKTIKELSALTDRELWDMGITRGEIYTVAYEKAGVSDLRRSSV